jgi:hypothetical protein
VPQGWRRSRISASGVLFSSSLSVLVDCRRHGPVETKSDGDLRQGFGLGCGKSCHLYARPWPNVAERANPLTTCKILKMLACFHCVNGRSRLLRKMRQSHGSGLPESCRNQSRMVEIRRP